MGDLIFVTGGARSGKSTFAEKTAKKAGRHTVYLATGIPFDEGMKARIARHQAERPADWSTIERYKNFGELIKNSDFMKSEVVILDCLTVMITNLMMDQDLDYDTCSTVEVDKVEVVIRNEIAELLAVCREKRLIMVTNELGMGLVPSYKLGSYFRDIAGRMNQYVAAEANEVYMTICGIPQKIK